MLETIPCVIILAVGIGAKGTVRRTIQRQQKPLDRELRAAPVAAVLVVLDLVVGLHAEPVGNGADA